MLLTAITTPLLHPGDDLAKILFDCENVQDGDIIVISSKAIATIENAFVRLDQIHVSEEATTWSKKTGRSPAFCEATLTEMQRLHGTIVGDCPGALLTEVRPDGLRMGSILIANAGLDESNVPKGSALGWPKDPVLSAKELRRNLETMIMRKRKQRIQRKYSSESSASSESSESSLLSVIITDSCCRPRRLGVTAFAMTVSGFDPLANQAGRKDLFGKSLRITTEAVADQLATAANFLMGNAGQSTPAVIIRDHGIPFSDFEGWVDGIEPEEDLFRGIV